MPRPRELAGHEDEIVARYLAGECAATIGASFFVTHPPVRRVLRDAGVQIRPRGPYRRPLAGMDQAVAELYRASLSLRDIAVLFDCSVIAVKSSLARSGEPLRPRGSHATKAEVERRKEVVAELRTVDSRAVQALVAKLSVRPEGGRQRKDGSR